MKTPIHPGSFPKSAGLGLVIAAAVAIGPARGAEPAKTPPNGNAANAAKASQSAMPPFETFSVLVERNIFDPARQPHQPAAEARPTTATTGPAAERIALEGVLINHREAVAFFEGTNPDDNRAVRRGEMIAGHKLVEIRTDRVRLAANGRQLFLPVAAQLTRQGSGDWEVTTNTTPVYATAAATTTGTASAPPAAVASENAEETEQSAHSGRSGRTSRRRKSEGDRARTSPESGMTPPGGAPAVSGAPAAGGGVSDEMLKKMMERRRKEMGQ